MGKDSDRVYLVDASSWRMLVSYLLPFDRDGSMRECIRARIQDKTILVLDAVHREVQHLEGFNKPDSLLTLPAEQRVVDCKDNLQKKVDNHWVVKAARREITDAEYAEVLARYRDSADYQLVAVCLAMKAVDSSKNYIVVTEESLAPDSKVFRKIPLICRTEGIECCNLIALLQELGIVGKFWVEATKAR